MLNSITACDLAIAASCPAESAACSFCAVMSVANLTTLYGRLAVQHRVVRGLDPDLALALAEAAVLSGVIFAAPQARPEVGTRLRACSGSTNRE